MEHTPGPWEKGWGNGLTGPTTQSWEPVCGGKDWPTTPVHKGQKTIAICPARCGPQEVGEKGSPIPGTDDANARLIAAAPELLERLDALLEQAEAMYVALGSNQAQWGDSQDEIDLARTTIAKATGGTA